MAAAMPSAPSSQPPCGHGIDVGADHHGAWRDAGNGSPEIPGLIDLDLRPNFSQFAALPVTRLLPLRGPADAASTIRATGQRGKLTQVRDHVLRVNGARGGRRNGCGHLVVLQVLC